MSLADELLNNLTDEEIAVYTTEDAEQNHIVIGVDRFITVPSELKRIAVQHDENVEVVTFDCPRYWKNLDMSKMKIYINYMLPSGKLGCYFANNVVIDELDTNIMHFDWNITSNATPEKGTLSFLVCIKKKDAGGKTKNHWNSELNREMYVSAGLECEEAIIAQYPDIITQILEQIDGEVIIANNPAVDKSLTIEGFAADAKATGRAISVERARIDALQAIPEGSTSADAALYDINIGYDGTDWQAPGAAVRGQAAQLANYIDNKTSQLSDDLVNLHISNINTELLNKIIDVKITPNKYIVGYDTTTFKPILAYSNNLSVIDFKIDTTNPLIKIAYDWENSLGNAYILYSDNKAINCAVGDFKNETEVVSSDNNSVTIDVRRGYFINYERCSIVVPINHTNVKSVDSIDCQMKSYIEGVADGKFINKNFINGMYGNAGDGSAIVYIDKILSETERDVLLKLNGDYEFLSVILWTSGFGYLEGYDYKRNATTDGIVIHLPINTEMIQITTSTPISNNNKINVVIDELLIDKRLNVIETNISDRISSGSYGDAGDGSRLASLGVTMAKDTEIILKCQEGYSYKMAAAVDTSKTIWEYGKFSLFENNYVKVVVPKGYSMIQFWLSEPTADNIKVKTYYEYSIKEKLEYVENKVDCNKPIMASVNMFNSIGAIGDSYTEGSCHDSQGVWHNVTNQSWVGTMAKRSGVDFNNYGQGGATTRSYIVNKLQSVLENNPDDIYFMALGQNDGNQAIPIGTIADIHDEDYTLNADTFYGCYGKIIQQVKNHAPKAKIVMIKGWIQGITWQNYDIAIEEIANHYNIPCISPFDDSFFSSNTYVDYMDGSHPTAMGYSMMGIAMERLFSKCVEENPSYFKYSTIG